MRKLIDPPLNALGRGIARIGLTANTVTLIGLGFGVLAMLAVVFHAYLLALGLIALSRIADGLDGAVARAAGKTDFGGYLDIASDFTFYGMIPFGFVLADPDANAVAGGFLLLSFYINGASFLGYAIMAEKLGLETRAQGIKSLYYSNGLLEGTETIGFFILLCLLPTQFAALAYIFGALCVLTAVLRVHGAYRLMNTTP
jgi:phosphatidylglycerophosphate synthase